MDPDDLIAEAVERTGLVDFGDGSYREGLDVLVDSINRDAKLNDIGLAAIPEQIVTNLTHRLRINGWLAQHPDLESTPVEQPLFVLGLPRTGTTLLSYLLDQDAAVRSLMRWETADPIPPPQAATFHTDPRIAAAAESAQMLDSLNPGFKAIHYEAPDGPTECVTLFAHEFRSLLYETLVNVPAYGAWLNDCDYRPAYAYHRRALQVLQSRAPGRWSLKSPAHCLGLDALVEHYPDARLVVTHRDPTEVCASLCSIITSLSGTFSDADHQAYITKHWVDFAELAVSRVMEFRDRCGDDRFIDVRYTDLVADPIGSVRAIYERFGDELTDETERAMAAYVDANPQGKHGKHRYTASDFGLDERDLDRRFADYRTRFSV